ncbi:MAG TPA: HEAT repeat domain-containing protein [Myxococcaceae bacterium]|nr:HEAT repeat domain-containing protein [Myxococcaceae bacterium]
MDPAADNLSRTDRAQGAQPPSVAGIRAGPALTSMLYLLLVASAALALWVRGYPGQAPQGVERLAPWAFLAFLAAFAVYRLALVRSGHYPAFKAFAQIAAGVLFFTLLLPGTWRPAATQGAGGDDLAVLLRDPSPRVRRLAAEVARYRANAPAFAHALAVALDDPDPRVRAEAHQSLVAISGSDLGAPEDAAARKAWQERYP